MGRSDPLLSQQEIALADIESGSASSGGASSGVTVVSTRGRKQRYRRAAIAVATLVVVGVVAAVAIDLRLTYLSATNAGDATESSGVEHPPLHIDASQESIKVSNMFVRQPRLSKMSVSSLHCQLKRANENENEVEEEEGREQELKRADVVASVSLETPLDTTTGGSLWSWQHGLVHVAVIATVPKPSQLRSVLQKRTNALMDCTGSAKVTLGGVIPVTFELSRLSRTIETEDDAEAKQESSPFSTHLTGIRRGNDKPDGSPNTMAVTASVAFPELTRAIDVVLPATAVDVRGSPQRDGRWIVTLDTLAVPLRVGEEAQIPVTITCCKESDIHSVHVHGLELGQHSLTCGVAGVAQSVFDGLFGGRDDTDGIRAGGVITATAIHPNVLSGIANLEDRKLTMKRTDTAPHADTAAATATACLTFTLENNSTVGTLCANVNCNTANVSVTINAGGDQHGHVHVEALWQTGYDVVTAQATSLVHWNNSDVSLANLSFTGDLSQQTMSLLISEWDLASSSRLGVQDPRLYGQLAGQYTYQTRDTLVTSDLVVDDSSDTGAYTVTLEKAVESFGDTISLIRSTVSSDIRFLHSFASKATVDFAFDYPSRDLDPTVSINMLDYDPTVSGFDDAGVATRRDGGNVNERLKVDVNGKWNQFLFHPDPDYQSHGSIVSTVWLNGAVQSFSNSSIYYAPPPSSVQFDNVCPLQIGKFHLSIAERAGTAAVDAVDPVDRFVTRVGLEGICTREFASGDGWHVAFSTDALIHLSGDDGFQYGLSTAFDFAEKTKEYSLKYADDFADTQLNIEGTYTCNDRTASIVSSTAVMSLFAHHNELTTTKSTVSWDASSTNNIKYQLGIVDSIASNERFTLSIGGTVVPPASDELKADARVQLGYNAQETTDTTASFAYNSSLYPKVGPFTFLLTDVIDSQKRLNVVVSGSVSHDDARAHTVVDWYGDRISDSDVSVTFATDFNIPRNYTLIAHETESSGGSPRLDIDASFGIADSTGSSGFWRLDDGSMSLNASTLWFNDPALDGYLLYSAVVHDDMEYSVTVEESATYFDFSNSRLALHVDRSFDNPGHNSFTWLLDVNEFGPTLTGLPLDPARVVLPSAAADVVDLGNSNIHIDTVDADGNGNVNGNAALGYGGHGEADDVSSMFSPQPRVHLHTDAHYYNNYKSDLHKVYDVAFNGDYTLGNSIMHRYPLWSSFDIGFGSSTSTPDEFGEVAAHGNIHLDRRGGRPEALFALDVQTAWNSTTAAWMGPQCP